MPVIAFRPVLRHLVCSLVRLKRLHRAIPGPQQNHDRKARCQYRSHADKVLASPFFSQT